MPPKNITEMLGRIVDEDRSQADQPVVVMAVVIAVGCASAIPYGRTGVKRLPSILCLPR
jgi:hypothetical protein